MADNNIPPRRRKRGVPKSLRGPAYSIKALETQKKRSEALTLRIAGASYPRIAKQMGCSVMTAYRWVNDAIADIPRDAAIECKAIMLEAIDADMVSLSNLLSGIKLTPSETAKLVLAKDRLRETKARLQGLNAPVRNEHTGKDGGAILTGHVDLEGMTDEQLERFKRDPAAYLSGMAGGRDSGAEEEAPGEAREARRTH